MASYCRFAASGAGACERKWGVSARQLVLQPPRMPGGCLGAGGVAQGGGALVSAPSPPLHLNPPSTPLQMPTVSLLQQKRPDDLADLITIALCLCVL